MNKKLEKNIDNIHPDILEVAEIELENYPFNLRQRKKATDLYVSKGLADGIAQEHLMKAFPDDKEVLDSFFRTGDTDGFHNGIYWSKKFMLVAFYNVLYKWFPHFEPNELDVVIAVDKNGNPELEIKYFDYSLQEWTPIENIIEVVEPNPDDDGGEEINPDDIPEPEEALIEPDAENKEDE